MHSTEKRIIFAIEIETQLFNQTKNTMKETVHVNIGSLAFTLDDDAYRALKKYLAEVERHLPNDDCDTMGDIERRIAEMLKERIHTPERVVSLAEVEEVMHRMGRPEQFSADGRCYREAQQEPNSEPELDHTRVRLYRSRTNRSIAGVCGGIAAYFNSDVTLVRLATLLLILFGGLSFWVYVILWIIIPEEPVRPINIHR